MQKYIIYLQLLSNSNKIIINLVIHLKVKMKILSEVYISHKPIVVASSRIPVILLILANDPTAIEMVN